MCFSHIFPCLSCDEGQVAQIENQEVSKKVIETLKAQLLYRKIKIYICWVSRCIHDSHHYNKYILYFVVCEKEIEVE